LVKLRTVDTGGEEPNVLVPVVSVLHNVLIQAIHQLGIDPACYTGT